MSNLSQFLGGTLTDSKVYYTQTSGTKTLVAHEGVDKIVYVRNIDGYFGAQDITGIRKITADFFINAIVDVSIPDGTGIGYVKVSFASPGAAPTGLTFDSSTGNLISCDAGSDMIYVHDGVSSTILTSFASPGINPYGLAFDSSTGNLISCDTASDLIYVHTPLKFAIILKESV